MKNYFKIIILGVLFAGLSVFFGLMLLKSTLIYDELLVNPKNILGSFAGILSGLILFPAGALLISLLIRPLKYTVLFFLLSATVILACLGLEIFYVVSVMINVAIGIYIAHRVQTETDDRLTVSTKPLRQFVAMTILVLMLVVTAMVYNGTAQAVNKQDFTNLSNNMVNLLDEVAQNFLLPDLPKEQQDQVWQKMRLELIPKTDQFVQEVLIPNKTMIAQMLAMLILSVLFVIWPILNWLTGLIIIIEFTFLKWTGMFYVRSETREAEYIVL